MNLDTNWLAALPLFTGLTAQEIAGVLACLSAREGQWEREAFLLRQGEAPGSMGLVLEGRVHILREDFWGNRDLIAAAGPGQLFGEAYACLPGKPLGVSVQAVSRCRVMLLDGSKILSPCANACPQHTALIRNLLAVTAEKNLLLNDKLTDVTHRSTREKVLSYLSREAIRQGGAEIEIPFDRQQLADYLAVDRSALSAELGKLRQEGRLQFRKNRFWLLRSATEI